MKTIRSMMGSLIASALMLSLSQQAMATTPPAPPQTNPSPSATAGAAASSRVDVDVDLRQTQTTNVAVTTGPTTSTSASNSTSNATGGSATANGGNVTLAAGAVAGGTSSVTGSGNSTNTNNVEGATIEEGAVDVNNEVRTGDNKVENKIDSHDKNINIAFVPPSAPSLAPAPMISECSTCYIDFVYAVQEVSGATSMTMPKVIKGKDLKVANDAYMTMKCLSDCPGVLKKPAKIAVLLVTANRVPSDSYVGVAIITAQADGKKAHLVQPHELQNRVQEAAWRLNFPEGTVLYALCSRKATVMHATLVTTGKGFGIAPGLGGAVLGGVGALTANLGSSSGTATNDWRPEVTCVIIRRKVGGVSAEVFKALDYQAVAQTVSVPK